jgi:hypothetical protein
VKKSASHDLVDVIREECPPGTADYEKAAANVERQIARVGFRLAVLINLALSNHPTGLRTDPDGDAQQPLYPRDNICRMSSVQGLLTSPTARTIDLRQTAH